MGEQSEQGRERKRVFQDKGHYYLEDFWYNADYPDGNQGVHATYSSGMGSDWNGKSVQECLDIFDDNNSFVSGQSFRYRVADVVYSSEDGLEESIELTFDEYLKLGRPNKIRVDRHISVPKDSLEGKAEGGGE